MIGMLDKDSVYIYSVIIFNNVYVPHYELIFQYDIKCKRNNILKRINKETR